MTRNGSDLHRQERLIDSLNAIRVRAHWLEKEFRDQLDSVADQHRESARNLLHYLALRRRDLRDIQQELAALGLSSMGRAESHVLGTIHPVLDALHRLIGREPDQSSNQPNPIAYDDGIEELAQNTDKLLGPPARAQSRTAQTSPIRVMVTMPSNAAEDYQLVRDLVDAGMSCMRINCAHDDRLTWSLMTANLRRACAETGRHCRLFMDLAGPKLRTGLIEPGPQVLHWSPTRNLFGETIAPARLWLTRADRPEHCEIPGNKTFPLANEVLAAIQAGDRIVLEDLRGQTSIIQVIEQCGGSYFAEAQEEAFIGGSSRLRIEPHDKRPPTEFIADSLTPVSQAVSLMSGDRLIVTSDPTPVPGAKRDPSQPYNPKISCSLPSVFTNVKAGERIFFDDGKFGGIIVKATPDELQVDMTHPASPKNLRAEKGINLPDSSLDLAALTEKDLADLDFVVDHADIVGFSFVNRPEDVEQLQHELKIRSKEDIALVLKIETETGFQNLPLLLLSALRWPSAGVMLARGDLAVECGYERLAEVQEEVLWICEAAHVPVIWATQVLDRLSKKGVPTRAEVTDAAMSERAECVMLNKGPNVVESVRLLQNIACRMRGHQEKKMSWLRALSISEQFGRVEGAED